MVDRFSAQAQPWIPGRDFDLVVGRKVSGGNSRDGLMMGRTAPPLPDR